MIKVKCIFTTTFIVISLSTAVIADENQQCQSILSTHANQQNPSLTQEEQKTLGNCSKNANWCMLYGLHIPNCQNNLHNATTTATTTPIPAAQPQTATTSSPETSQQSTEEVNTAPINHKNETTTTTPSQPDNNQPKPKPNINWF